MERLAKIIIYDPNNLRFINVEGNDQSEPDDKSLDKFITIKHTEGEGPLYFYSTKDGGCYQKAEKQEVYRLPYFRIYSH